ncbi:unnamed protein product, partial [Orchesella dallaii]
MKEAKIEVTQERGREVRRKKRECSAVCSPFPIDPTDTLKFLSKLWIDAEAG